MINKIFSIILGFISGLSFSQNTNPTYFDKDWKETTKEKSSFYRSMPSKKIGNLVLIEDYYNNKSPQFQGYSLQNDENSYVGEIVWYDENGFDLSVYQYYNNTANSVLSYFYPNNKKRKTVTYKKGIRNGETIIYSEDGTVLMKGIYINGKPKSGDFEDIKYVNEYRYNKSDRKQQRADEENGISPTIVEDESYQKSVEKNTLDGKTINKKIFWSGSKQLAQETLCDLTSYNLKSLEQITYDRTGKILQTLAKKDFDSYGDVKNGVKYEYYLQNYFAVALKKKTEYLNGKKSGQELSYFPNGKLAKKSFYVNNFKDGEEVEYTENGSIKYKRTFKNGVPFSGNFDEDFKGNFIINTNYSNGLKEGAAVAKTNKDSIVATGVYKSNKPFNGSFIVKINDNENQLINVENYKKTGLQTVFRNGFHDISKTYTFVDDKANGEAVFYKKNAVVGRLVYKDDKPFDGYLITSDENITYKNGYITQIIKYRDNSQMQDSDILMIKSYTDNKLSKIVYNFFRIDKVFQDSFEGIYKDGKPFSGYFLSENKKPNYVNYFENGILKFQYSTDYLKKEEDNYPFYNIKSTYKEGKIFDGVEYTISDNQIISKYLKNGELKSFDYDFFVAYYGNRFHFELKNDAIEIRIFSNNKLAKIVIDNTLGKETMQLLLNDEILFSQSTFNYESAVSFPKGAQSIYYYQLNNSIVAKKIYRGDVGHERGDGDNWKLLMAFFGVVNNKTGNAGEIFNKLAEDLSAGRIANMLAHDDENSLNELIANVELNKDGKPEMGTVIKKTENVYTLKTYYNAQLILEKNNISFENLKTECEKMEKILYDRLNNRSK